MRGFYQAYPQLLHKGHALRDLSNAGSGAQTDRAATTDWQPGQLHTALDWTHYRTLLKVARREARDFYETEAVKNAWSARQLERQIASLLFERLAKSRDKQGVLALASVGLEPTQPVGLIKDPYVLEFLDLPEVPRLHESQLEEALISQLQVY